MLIVSACLAGVACRYDGTSQPDPRVEELIRRGQAIPVCPEQLGGLPTPRPPFEILDGRAVDRDGHDVTEECERGAAEALRLAKLAGCTAAVLKHRSPSCGAGIIYDGTFSRKLIPGDGKFAELLKAHGFKVVTEENFDDLDLQI